MRSLLNILFTITTIVLFASCASAPKDPMPQSYEVECVEGIAGNSYKYLSWGLGEDNAAAEEDAIKAAVYAAMVNRGSGSCAPLMNTSEAEKNKDFIKQFYVEGNGSNMLPVLIEAE